MDFSDTSSDELVEHNAWNPMLELFFHAQFGENMEVLVDEEELGRIALSSHLALDVPCDKSETRCAQWHWKEASIGPQPGAQTRSSHADH